MQNLLFCYISHCKIPGKLQNKPIKNYKIQKFKELQKSHKSEVKIFPVMIK